MSARENMKAEILKKLQGLSENITDSIGEIAKGKSAFCSTESTKERLSICRTCPEYISSTSQCRRCGCFMSAKTKLKHASCPLGKWGKVL